MPRLTIVSLLHRDLPGGFPLRINDQNTRFPRDIIAAVRRITTLILALLTGFGWIQPQQAPAQKGTGMMVRRRTLLELLNLVQDGKVSLTLEGSTLRAIPAMRGRPKTQVRGGPFVLIGPDTFSSGVWAAQDMRKKAKARVVGTTTGGLLGGYGEAPSRRLPYSRLRMQWTIKYFSSQEPVRPDITVITTAADLRAGRDPVLDAAIAAAR